MKNKILGGMYGALIGDACGVPYEFKSANAIPKYDHIDIIPPVGFKRSWDSVQPGTYSDDGAQMLSTAHSLT